ncbi:MAG: hypothetical protein AAF612_10450 [Planctomycetota bacterium]
MPTLERVTQFTAARHALITHNIANLSTPNFRPTDVSVEGFQRQLGKALERRRRRPNPTRGDLPLADSREIRVSDRGLRLRPQQNARNVTFHDRNNRDLERLMQDLAENAMIHNAAISMMRSRVDILKTAIRERVS